MTLEFILYHAGYIGVAVLLSLSLSYVWRANLFSLGHYGFFASGAYAAAAVSQVILAPDSGWFVASDAHRAFGAAWLLLTLVTGGLVAALAAFATGLLFSSIRGDYFAVATLILAELTISLISNWSYVGGGIGVNVPYLVFSNSGGEHFYYVLFYAAVALALAGAMLWLCLRVERSDAGLWLMAIRDDELASEASGIAVKKVQLAVFTMGGAVAGGAGALFLQMTTFVAPTDFTFISSIPVILYVVLGGGRPVRCVVVTVVLYAIYELIKLRFLGLFGESVGDLVNNWRDSIMGAVLILSAAIPLSLGRWKVGRPA